MTAIATVANRHRFPQAITRRLDRRPIVDLTIQGHRVASMRVGRIVVAGGQLSHVQPRWSIAAASIAGVYWDNFCGRDKHSRCEIDFHVPRGMPSFLTLDYIRSGRSATYADFRRCVRTLEQIGRIKRSYAIVANITNPAITDRLLTRFGWQQHCLTWKGRHWIRRLNDDTPPRDRA